MVKRAATLLEMLAEDLVRWMYRAPDDVPRRVLLWLDPDRQFSRLVPHLDSALQERDAVLMRYDPESGQGQFAIKLALLRLESTDTGRAVVYLPGFSRQALEPVADGGLPELWALYDYRFRGCVWGLGGDWDQGMLPDMPTLLGWLRQCGVVFADEKTANRLSAGGDEPLLARYVESQRDSTPGDWPRPIRYSDVEEALAGNPRDALMRLLAAPNNEVKRWGAERPLIIGRISAEYGLVLPDGDLTADAIADDFAIQIALTEAWDAFGQPSDFLFLSRLPPKAEHRDRLIHVAREDIVKHTVLCPRFFKRMGRLEVQYDLARWSAERSGQPACLPRLARWTWQRFLDRFDKAASRGWKKALAMLLEEHVAVDSASSGPWDKTEVGTRWWLMRDLASLGDQSREAVSEAQSSNTCVALVEAYGSRWWQIDHLHLSIRAACAREDGLEKVRRVCDMAYFDYVSNVNQRFTDLVEQEAEWPPKGTTGVEIFSESVWEASRVRRAVLMIDALRWDLGRYLKDELGEDCALECVMATLPTKTSFGMAALLPLDLEQVAVDFGVTGTSIKQGDGHNLAEREGRKRYLEAALSGRRSRENIHFADLEALLQGGTVPEVPLVVVMDNRIDEQGEKGAEELPALAEHLVGKLKRAIGQLHAAGVDIVYVVTDHGFLFLPADAVDNLGRPEIPVACAHVREARWAAMKPDAFSGEVFSTRLPLDRRHTLGFPRGVRTLMKASPYLHGGISLQECVIPRLESRVSLQQPRLGVDVRVTANELSGGTVPLVIAPVQSETQVPLGGIPPLNVKIWVETAVSDAEPQRVTEPIEVPVRSDVEELRPPIYLQEGMGLDAGQELILKVTVKETGEELASIRLTMLVDWR